MIASPIHGYQPPLCHGKPTRRVPALKKDINFAHTYAIRIWIARSASAGTNVYAFAFAAVHYEACCIRTKKAQASAEAWAPPFQRGTTWPSSSKALKTLATTNFDGFVKPRPLWIFNSKIVISLAKED